MRRLFGIGLSLFCFAACAPEKAGSPWKKRAENYHYRLLAFENMERLSENNDFARLDLVFSTQDDSIFWDSRSNFSNTFYLALKVSGEDFLRKELLDAAEADSFCLLMSPPDFFKQRFGLNEVPLFCEGDSVVKLNCRVQEFLDTKDLGLRSNSLREREDRLILEFFGDSIRQDSALHASGFYWVEKPGQTGDKLVAGDKVKVRYKGYFLNGRLMDEGDPDFRMLYGEPSQLIEGLNNVMGILKDGQNAKIIIPSRLAFGGYGSSTGIVPPYTPLLYEISVHRE